MSISRRSIASALATAFSAAIVTAPSGETAIRVCDYKLPDRIDVWPAVYIFPPEETFEYPPSLRVSEMDWRVRFYLAKVADTGRQTDLLYKWSDVLPTQLDDRVQLSLGGAVLVADVVGMKAGTLFFADEAFDGIELILRIAAQESVTFAG